MGKQAYQDILSKEKESTNVQLKQMIERVGHRIAAVSAMPNLEWEFKVIESEQKNAFALPGGKNCDLYRNPSRVFERSRLGGSIGT